MAGYTLDLRVSKVNRTTWKSGNTLARVSGVSLTRNISGNYPLLESGTMQVVTGQPGSFSPGWYRIEALLDTGTSRNWYALATLYFESDGGVRDKTYTQWDCDGVSVLQPLSDQVLQKVVQIPKGENAIRWLVRKLRGITPAPIYYNNSFTLAEPMTFAPGTTYQQMMWDVLDVKGMIVRINGSGEIYLRSKATTPSVLYDADSTNVIQPETNFNYDRKSIPNRYITVSPYTGSVVVTSNTSYPGSKTSYSARNNRWIDHYDDNPTLLLGETVGQYERRKLEELSTHANKIKIVREFIPGLTLFDLVECDIPDHGLSGQFRIYDQSFDFTHGITVTETLASEVKEYKAS